MATTITTPTIGTLYLTAHVNPVNLCRFTCTRCERAGVKHVIELPEGAIFPKCIHYEAPVTWRLESYM